MHTKLTRMIRDGTQNGTAWKRQKISDHTPNEGVLSDFKRSFTWPHYEFLAVLRATRNNVT